MSCDCHVMQLQRAFRKKVRLIIETGIYKEVCIGASLSPKKSHRALTVYGEYCERVISEVLRG